MILTARQLEIINLVKLGYTNKQIGYELFISEKTVKAYLSRALALKGARNRAHLVYLCLTLGEIEGR
ncbi:hypothetical protein LCGC14_0476880 [marine sediment metagenome]|uniref:HTH luxR-type domain-containing protein n=1 Tax=marine sediment metagenome TaxID=412755 RepID=A0A0F9UXF9_9ZZZZ